MLFPTLSFAAFFAVVLPVSWLLMPHRVRWRLFMVGASWFFYGAADWRFVPLLAGSTVVNHFFARRIHHSAGPARRAWTIFAVTTNLAVLAWFKYVGFLSLTLQSTLHAAGIHAHVPLPEVILPVGISFFTFQALSYVIDTSRGKILPVSLLEFAVYLSFFPHLIAGPIVRATEFLPQIKEKIDPRNVDVGKAFWLISLGLFKKVVISSYLSTYAADPLFGYPHQHAGVEALFGVYAYAIQIYMDFSGYTDIAIGLALLLGIKFPQNFNAPYAAASLQDFWRRWHMTLSRWLRDYLYIPLGGSRQGRTRTYVNIMITMLLGGLWHGAAWTFVAWGALHGIGLCVERWHGERRAAPTEEVGKGVPVPAAGPPPPSSAVAVEPTARQPRVVTLARSEGSITARVATGDAPRSERPARPIRDARWWVNTTATPPPPASSVKGGETPPSGLDPDEAFRPPASSAPAPPPQPPAPDPAAGLDTVPSTPPGSTGRGAASPAAVGTMPAKSATATGASPPPAAGGAAWERARRWLPQGRQAGKATDAPPPSDGRTGRSPRAQYWIGWFITFHVVCLAWIFFRATSFHNALEVMGRIADIGGRHRPFNWKIAAVIVGALAIQLGPRGGGAKLQVLFSRCQFWVQALILAGVLTVIDLLGPAGVAPFIYFKF